MFIILNMVAISERIWYLSYQVIETVGKGITQLDFHKAFCANIAAVIAVVVSTIFKVR